MKHKDAAPRSASLPSPLLIFRSTRLLSRPMSTVTPDEFIDYLKRSALLPQREIDATTFAIRRDVPQTDVDATRLAGEFVKRGLLTEWHVRQLLKRKYKGFTLGRYRVLGRLGTGGMSSVYLAEHDITKRREAVKVLPKPKATGEYLKRFHREAQALASLNSPYVVDGYGADERDGVHFVAMEYFESLNLRQLVEKLAESGEALPYEDAASYIRQAALGLQHAHERGLVHRDVKPENVLVDARKQVKIIDFGLALFVGSAVTPGSEKRILGTADYLAPEQTVDSHNVDVRADVYGLGATLYFCLVGRPPFPDGSVPERLLAHRRKEPTSVFAERLDAWNDLLQICAKMMAKNPNDRFQTAAEVVDATERCLVRHGFAKPFDFGRRDADFANLGDGDLGVDVEGLFLASDAASKLAGAQNLDVPSDAEVLSSRLLSSDDDSFLKSTGL